MTSPPTHLIDVENVISRQLSLAHGTHHDVTQRREMLLANRNVGIRRLNVHVDLENLGDCLLHLHEPLLSDVVNGVLVAVDDVADAVSTVEVLLLLGDAAAAGALEGRPDDAL